MSDLAAAISRLTRRVLLVVGRGRTTLVDDSKAVQLHQVRMGADELRDGTPRLAEYGLASNPPPGSDAVLLFIAGERSQGVVIATGNQTVRVRNLASGEVMLHDNLGRQIYLSAAGIVVQGASSPVTVRTTSDVDAVAGGAINLQAGGVLTLKGNGGVVVQGPVFDVQSPSTLQNTVITGALTNNGVNVGSGHGHQPGSFKANNTAITGTSGAPTP